MRLGLNNICMPTCITSKVSAMEIVGLLCGMWVQIA